ncbi:uncharacterized protein MYCFIDRAFT_197725 [Pseudocercospora fijiensis CIRAD86]|uniref:Uncharacterized protein n=1 Tax=Pseudocercospora fijiensis (strain CIRAD86) TaxID=383855 RepID=M2YSZ8_PSEFD|nr:uncharacterized protein MYCFIDRAFT_197725 [Pseudocercospora fijiensis CIRAD86]EME80835.1 hypothetical protein MYCFIDRAFT_197725 [Pseudocercospora fijiensis CIRAD86]
MVPRYELVTYSCLHFTIYSVSDTPSPIPDDDSLFGLWTKPTVKYRHNNWRCARPECQNIQDWPTRIDAAVQNIRQYLESTSEQYENVGYEYHGIHVAIKAHWSRPDIKYISLAHEQFGIRTCDWWDDPFFDRWHEICDLLGEIQGFITEGLDDSAIMSVANRINKCRGLLGRIERRMQKLMLGVKQLKQNEDDYGPWARSVQKPASASKKEGPMQPTAMLASIVLEKWMKRQAGFLDYFQLRDADRVDG